MIIIIYYNYAYQPWEKLDSYYIAGLVGLILKRSSNQIGINVEGVTMRISNPVKRIKPRGPKVVNVTGKVLYEEDYDNEYYGGNRNNGNRRYRPSKNWKVELALSLLPRW